jgi:hypothetical protein
MYKSLVTNRLPKAEKNAQAAAVEHLGPEGRSLWVSKADYLELHKAHAVIFNAVAFNKEGRYLWCGDINLSLMLEDLQQLAEEIGAFVIAPESPFAKDGLGDHLDIFESRQKADNAARWYSLFVFNPGQIQIGRLRVQGMSDEVVKMLAGRVQEQQDLATAVAV